MACPPEITIQNLNAVFGLNRQKSSDADAALTLQGVSWLMRKAISVAKVTLAITEYVEPNADDPANAPIHKIDIEQTASPPGIKTQEKRVTDWRPRQHQDRVFGKVEGQSRLIRGSKDASGKVRPNIDVQIAPKNETIVKFLRGETTLEGDEDPEGFLVDDIQDKDGVEYGEGEGLWLQSWVKSVDNGWIAEQVWGFEILNGERWHVRRLAVAKGDKWLIGRLAYEYQGPNSK